MVSCTPLPHTHPQYLPHDHHQCSRGVQQCRDDRPSPARGGQARQPALPAGVPHQSRVPKWLGQGGLHSPSKTVQHPAHCTTSHPPPPSLDRRRYTGLRAADTWSVSRSFSRPTTLWSMCRTSSATRPCTTLHGRARARLWPCFSKRVRLSLPPFRFLSSASAAQPAPSKLSSHPRC